MKNHQYNHTKHHIETATHFLLPACSCLSHLAMTSVPKRPNMDGPKTILSQDFGGEEIPYPGMAHKVVTNVKDASSPKRTQKIRPTNANRKNRRNKEDGNRSNRAENRPTSSNSMRASEQAQTKNKKLPRGPATARRKEIGRRARRRGAKETATNT